MAFYDKRNCLERAHRLLSTEDDNSFRYACLELRFCIEAIVYEKLETYSEYIPAKVFTKWQPNHALKILMQFEPEADQDFTLTVYPESESGIPTNNKIYIGKHNSFKLNWLTKNYNILGSYLHVIMGKQKEQETKEELSNIRKNVVRILWEVKRILDSEITHATFTTIINFECQSCGRISAINENYLRKFRRAACINPQCNASYMVSEDGEGWSFKLAMTGFKCLKCEKDNFLENKDLDIGMKFRCRFCKEPHVISVRQWGYSRITIANND